MEHSRQQETPRIIKGELSVDERGQVAYANGFHFEGVKRFYVVSNHKAGFVRAWHAHRHEAKFATVVQGAALIAAVPIDNWEHPSKDAKPYRFVLSANNPAVLYIPPTYANGFMSLTEDCKVMFFSTATVEESKKDDVRFDARYWDVWHIIER
jgi:dTDP-4-dehydrorhamnose 3,5-epimerase